MVAMSDFSTFSQITWGSYMLANETHGMASRHRGDRREEAQKVDPGSTTRVEGGRRPRRTHWDAIGVFLADTLCLSFALLEGMLVLKLRSHFQVRCLRECCCCA
jgi:hypothetical protein